MQSKKREVIYAANESHNNLLVTDSALAFPSRRDSAKHIQLSLQGHVCASRTGQIIGIN
jgi:hypothetical protein